MRSLMEMPKTLIGRLLAALILATGLVAQPGFAAAVHAAAVAEAAIGYDVSYLDCETQLPATFGFAIVNVNDGRPYTANPCLASEVAWALTGSSSSQPVLSFYVNTANPGPDVSAFWPQAGTTDPRPCDGSWSASCAYDYGWFGALGAFTRANDVVGPDMVTTTPWWLDVETDNSWSDDQSTNVAALQGAVAALQAQGIAQVGIYATRAHWAEITGATSPASRINAPFAKLPNWVPLLGSVDDARTGCAPTRSLTGGPVVYVQYEFFLDKNIACF